MKKVSLTLLSILLVASVFAQTSIVIQNGTKVYVSNVMDSIQANVASGDTVYLPGGVLSGGTWEIDKEVHIFGVGFYPDSTTATGDTYFPSLSFYLANGSSNSTIEGVKLNNHIYFGKYPGGLDSVTNVLIKRCEFSGLDMGAYSSSTGAQNITFSECFIKNTVSGRYAKYLTFEKCIFNGSLNTMNGNVLFTNCIFINYDCSGYSYTPIFSTTSNILFKNNIFLNPCQIPGATYSTFKNNIFCFANPFTGTNSVDASNQFLNNVDSVKFVSYSQTVGGRNYQYTDNFQLQSVSPAKNAGDDGFDCGIYGTSVPTKPGWVPMTPHIQFFQTAPNTTNGKLPVQVKVRAQSSY